MELEITSIAHVNSVYLIKSMKTSEVATTQQFTADLSSLLQNLCVPFTYNEPKDHDDLTLILDNIAHDAREGRRPILQFYMHGHPTEGLYIAGSGEYYDWQLLAEKLRAINKATANNLCVVSAVCFGLNVIRQNSIHDAVMSHCLIAPEKEIYIKFVEDDMVKFYEHVFRQLGLFAAYEKYLLNLKFFHCEKLLVTVIARYFKYHCMGDGLEINIKGIFEGAVNIGVDISDNKRPHFEAYLRRELAPSNTTFQKYASTFLAGRTTNVTFEDIMRLVQYRESDVTTGK